MAATASLQWIAVPWAAAILVWTLGRPAVLPLAVILATLYLPMTICLLYVRRRRVETTVRNWTPKRLRLALLSVLPYLLFMVGCLYAFWPTGSSFVRGAAIGVVIGTVGAGWALFAPSRRRPAPGTVGGDDD